jgi:cell division protein ZapA
VSTPVNVKILDREFAVGVEPGEQESLLASARFLDARMREIRGNNRMVAIDQLAVLAALNLAHEFLQLKKDLDERDGVLHQTLGDMNRKLDGLFDSLPR